ncbi:uncharacterized protein LOC114519517, partial [Dendronephthya gigantea]|uniref:uncharacterized protein LOC114519517 n=1 Tax=Dendronephthya gigantea TaxID=151771 RepID=UPI001069F6EC
MNGSMNVCEEERLQFWDEIRKQVECGENKEDRWKKTILWRAFQFSPVDQEIVKYLVDHGADIYSKNENGETVLRMATRNGLFELVKYFIQYGSDKSGKTALHHAVDAGVTDIVKYLAEQCAADVNGKKTNGETLLHAEGTKGTFEMVKYLVENGADVNGKDSDGWTVLHYAVTTDRLEIVKYLVE